MKNWAPTNKKEDLKPGFEEKIRFLKIFLKIFFKKVLIV